MVGGSLSRSYQGFSGVPRCVGTLHLISIKGSGVVAISALLPSLVALYMSGVVYRVDTTHCLIDSVGAGPSVW